MIRFTSLLLALSVSFAALGHAYHVSLMQVRYNPAKSQLEVALKVFTDDFEQALARGQAGPVSLEESPRPQVAALAAGLLRRSVSFGTTPGETLPLEFLGFEKEKDAHWLYFSVKLAKPVSGIIVRNKVLLDSFPDQTNIVNVEANGKKQSALFRSATAQQLSW